MALLPETCVFRGAMEDYPNAVAHYEKLQQTFASLACSLKLAIYVGSLHEPCNDESGLYWNTALFYSSQGECLGRYRKQHLFCLKSAELSVDESLTFRTGYDDCVVAYDDWRWGLSICFDLRFPEMYRRYQRKGVEILVVSAVFTYQTGEAHWETLLRARAIENLSFVVAINQVGTDERGVRAYGHTMVVSPWGEVLCRMDGEQEGLCVWDLDRQKLI